MADDGDGHLNPVTTATEAQTGTNTALAAGQTYVCPPGMTTALSGIAATAQSFSGAQW
jgi:hypothetical protein